MNDLRRVLAFLVLTVAVLGCESRTPPAPPVTPTPSAPVAAWPAPLESVLTVPTLWVRSGIDPAPGPVVVGIISDLIGVAPPTVTAAVLMFEHPAGNLPWVWVFRATGVTSTEAIARLVAAEVRCPGPATSASLADLPATMVRRNVGDQCQPEYLVALDNQTVALIVDDGGYEGNDPANPTPVPYRSTDEIAQLVAWLKKNLADIPLATGGPPQING